MFREIVGKCPECGAPAWITGPRKTGASCTDADPCWGCNVTVDRDALNQARVDQLYRRYFLRRI